MLHKRDRHGSMRPSSQKSRTLFQYCYPEISNMEAVRFQLAYCLLRAFDLYGQNAPEAIHLEAFQDVDVKGNRRMEIAGAHIGNQYIQVKTSRKPWDWGKFSNSGIIQNFLHVWQAEPAAELLVVTDFRYEGALAELAKFCSGERFVLSGKLKRELQNLCDKAGCAGIAPEKLARRISFVQTTEEELSKRIMKAIVKHMKPVTAGPELHLSILMGRFLDWALKGKEVRADDLESIELSLRDATGSEDPLTDLIRVLDTEKLEAFVENSFADPDLDRGGLLAALTKRCLREPLGIVNRVAAALFTAGETTYYLQHKHLFDEAFEKLGEGAVSWLCSSTMPSAKSSAITYCRR